MFFQHLCQINKDVIIGWSVNDPKYDNARLLKVWCNSSTAAATTTVLLSSEEDDDDDDSSISTTGLPSSVGVSSVEDDTVDGLGSDDNKTANGVKTAKKCE